MSTRSCIAVKQRSGKVESVYCHSNGYPEDVGAALQRMWYTPNNVRHLLEAGNIGLSYLPDVDNVTELPDGRYGFRDIEHDVYSLPKNTKKEKEKLVNLIIPLELIMSCGSHASAFDRETHCTPPSWWNNKRYSESLEDLLKEAAEYSDFEYVYVFDMETQEWSGYKKTRKKGNYWAPVDISKYAAERNSTAADLIEECLEENFALYEYGRAIKEELSD